MTSLKTLKLAFCDISEIKNLDNLTKLEKLELNGNKITSLKGLENLSCLTELAIFSNKLPNKIREKLLITGLMERDTKIGQNAVRLSRELLENNIKE